MDDNIGGWIIWREDDRHFNPFSILNAFDSMAIRDYWFSTGTPPIWFVCNTAASRPAKLAGHYYVPSLFCGL